MKVALLSPDKVAITYFASIEKDLTKIYKKAHTHEAPATHSQQVDLFKKILLDFLKQKTEDSNKENHQSAAVHPDKRSITLAMLHTQERLLDREEKIQRVNRERDLEFELTRKFVGQFMKDMHFPPIESGRVNLTEPVLGIKRRDSEQLIRNRSEFECHTDRDSTPTETAELRFVKQNKALARLNKLERFLLKVPNSTKHVRTELNSSTWNFSPTKADYKLENETLKVLQEHLRSRVGDASCSEDYAAKEQSLKQRERRIVEQEQSLFKKELVLNRRHMEIIIKEKQLKIVA